MVDDKGGSQPSVQYPNQNPGQISGMGLVLRRPDGEGRLEVWGSGSELPEHDMSLHDMGFSSNEVEAYMRLLMEGTGTQSQRMKMLDKRRSDVLNEIHLKERQIDHIDYFRYEIRKNIKQTS